MRRLNDRDCQGNVPTPRHSKCCTLQRYLSNNFTDLEPEVYLDEFFNIIPKLRVKISQFALKTQQLKLDKCRICSPVRLLGNQIGRQKNHKTPKSLLPYLNSRNFRLHMIHFHGTVGLRILKIATIAKIRSFATKEMLYLVRQVLFW